MAEEVGGMRLRTLPLPPERVFCFYSTSATNVYACYPPSVHGELAERLAGDGVDPQAPRAIHNGQVYALLGSCVPDDPSFIARTPAAPASTVAETPPGADALAVAVMPIDPEWLEALLQPVNDVLRWWGKRISVKTDLAPTRVAPGKLVPSVSGVSLDETADQVQLLERAAQSAAGRARMTASGIALP